MSVYKEAMYCVATIVKQQKQIYNDAADYGVPIKTLKDPIFNSVNQLIDQYGDKNDYRHVDHYLTGKTVTRELTMIDEFGDGRQFKIRLIYCTVKSKKNDPSSLVGPIIGILSLESPKWTTAKDNKYMI